MFVPEGYRLQRKDRFARFVHWLDHFLETYRGNDRPEVTAGIYNDADTSRYRDPVDASNVGVSLSSCRANTDRTAFASNTHIANVDIATTGGEF